MAQKVAELSIFFPFWNEEKNIETVVTKAASVAQKVAAKWEILMVDDGSSDDTLKIARSLAKKDPSHLRVVAINPNRGYGAALKTGLSSAKYNLVVFTDGDDQFDFGEVTKFLEKIDKCDMVIGRRKKRVDHPFRHVLMTLLKMWDFIFFGFYFRDIDCGFKLFTRRAVEKIMPLHSEGAMITTEILAKAKAAKLKILEVDVNHYPRKFGDQSGGNIRVITRAILESWKLWKNLHYGRA